MNHPYTIVLFGACNSGKSSIINAVTGINDCPVSEDGSPKTSTVRYVESANKVYIDTPGICKSPSKMLQLPFPEQESPSFIWLVVNFQAAIEDDEFNILDANRDIPAIIILNKVDTLISEAEVENFDKLEYSTNNRKLTVMHQRLMDKKKSNSNIRHIVIMSLKDENNDERPPIGIDFLRRVTDTELEKSKPINTQSEGSDVTIAVIGYSSSGKSSLINAILYDSKAAAIGLDGSLTTKEWTCYPVGQVHLWDSPAVNKRAVGQEQNIIPIDSKLQPDIIWLILNYQSSDVEDEPDLHSILQIDPNIPIIVVINKVDILRKIPDLSERDIVEFSHDKFASSKISTRKKLVDLMHTISNKWPKLINLKAVTVTSLYDDRADDENFKIIGINALLDITRAHLKSDNKRCIFDNLKQANVEHSIVQAQQTKRSCFLKHIQHIRDALIKWLADKTLQLTPG